LATFGIERTLAGPVPLDTKESKAVVQPAPPPECRWTGFYIGGHVGYSWSDDWSFLELDETDPAHRFSPDGLVGGGQVGYNFQLGSWFVIGLEGTFVGTDIDDHDTILNGSETTRGKLESDWLATVGGRLGVTFWQNRFLAYGKGAAAFTEWDFHTREINDDERFHKSQTETLPLVGVGLEYAIGCHWSVRFEYNHIFFGDREDVTGLETEGTRREKRSFRADKGDWDLIQAGVNFRF
jgi:outer membrane immunogenic protein